jgi:hypothetical protein
VNPFFWAARSASVDFVRVPRIRNNNLDRSKKTRIQIGAGANEHTSTSQKKAFSAFLADHKLRDQSNICPDLGLKTRADGTRANLTSFILFKEP